MPGNVSDGSTSRYTSDPEYTEGSLQFLVSQTIIYISYQSNNILFEIRLNRIDIQSNRTRIIRILRNSKRLSESKLHFTDFLNFQKE